MIESLHAAQSNINQIYMRIQQIQRIPHHKNSVNSMQQVEDKVQLSNVSSTQTNAPAATVDKPVSNFNSMLDTRMQLFNQDGIVRQRIHKEPQVHQSEFGRKIDPPQTETKTPELTGKAKIEDIITYASNRYGIDEALIKAVIKQESNWNPYAVSRAGAQGLMQLMPGTADELGVTNSFDAKQNIMGGTRYLSELIQRFDGDIRLALAAYNAGPSRVERVGDIPNIRETQHYVSTVYKTYQQTMDR